MYKLYRDIAVLLLLIKLLQVINVLFSQTVNKSALHPIGVQSVKNADFFVIVLIDQIRREYAVCARNIEPEKNVSFHTRLHTVRLLRLITQFSA